MPFDRRFAPNFAEPVKRIRSAVVIRRLLAAVGVVTVLASCDTADKFSAQSVEYNLQAETIKNQSLLLNVVRAAYRKPLQFTDLTTITGQRTLSGTAAFTLPFAGPANNQGRLFQFSPSVTASDSPTFTVAVLNTKEFYQGILTPLPMQTIAYYVKLGIPISVLLTLTISDIAYGSPDALTRVHNDPYGYDRFQHLLQSMLDLGLSVEYVSETSVIGTPFDDQGLPKATEAAALDAKGVKIVRHALGAEGGGLPPDQVARFRRIGHYYQLEQTDLNLRFCFDRQLTRNGIVLTTGMAIGETGEHLQASAICGAANQPAVASPDSEQQRAAGKHSLQTAAGAGGPDTPAGPHEFFFITRSTEAMIYFLGELARHDLGIVEPRFTPAVLGNSGPNIFFHLSPGAGGENAISVSYEGHTYHIDVDPSGHDRSSQIMELVTEVLAQNNSAKDLPAPSVIPITR